MRGALLLKAALALGLWLFLPWQIVKGGGKPEYLASFNPEQGFKPAQSDLTEIFLQLAGSLEFYGSPEPYLRHVKREHARIEGKYRQRFGTEPKSHCPAYLTDAYLDRLAANWKLLSPKLGLEPLAKNTGNLMRDAINGTRGNGTMLVGIFNRHQALVYAAMAGKGNLSANFDVLKTELISRLEIDKTTIHDENYKILQRDAVDFTIGIRGGFIRLFQSLDDGLSPADASRIKAAILRMVTDVGHMAQSELEAAIAERALDRQAVAK